MSDHDSRTQLAALQRCLLLAAMPSVFITFALPLRAAEIGASATEIGALFSVFTGALLLIRPLVGYALDRVGRKPFLYLALAAYGLTNTTFALADGLAGLFLARAFHGLAMATLLITADAMTADLTSAHERGAAMGGNMQSAARGGILGATLGFSLVGAVPAIAWSASFAAFAGLALAALVIPYLKITETAEGNDSGSIEPPGRPPPALIRLFLVVTLTGFAAALIQPLYLVYLQGRFDLELRALAAVFLPVGLAYALLPVRLGRLTARLPRRLAMAGGLALAGASYLVVPQLAWLLAMIALFVLAAVGSALAELTRNAWVAELAPPGTTGRAYAMVELAAGLGAVVGPLVGGALYDSVSPASVFAVGGALLVLAGAAAGLAVEFDRR